MNQDSSPPKKQTKNDIAGPASGIYGLAFIGAVIYYIQHAETFAEGLLGVLKALVWPAIFAYEFLEFISL